MLTVSSAGGSFPRVLSRYSNRAGSMSEVSVLARSCRVNLGPSLPQGCYHERAFPFGPKNRSGVSAQNLSAASFTGPESDDSPARGREFARARVRAGNPPADSLATPADRICQVGAKAKRPTDGHYFGVGESATPRGRSAFLSLPPSKHLAVQKNEE